MSLTTRCPKCESHVREGARRCPLCGLPLSGMAFEPSEPVEGAPILDPLLGLFERDEPIRACPSCWNEFVAGLKTCAACQATLKVVPRSSFEAHLRLRPVFDRGARLVRGPEDHPRDLVRVFQCRDPAEARARVKEFRFMGVRLWTGSDTLDVDPDTSRIGLYVRPADHESAKYLLLGDQKPREERRPAAPDVRDARQRRLESARGYFELGKFRHVLVLLRDLAGDADADDLASEALLRSGAVREAERKAAAAADAAPPSAARGRMLAHAGVFAALGNDGTPFRTGARPSVARRRLVAAVEDAPRLLEAGAALIEVHRELGDDAAALAELRRLARLNPNFLALDGHFRSLHEELRQQIG